MNLLSLDSSAAAASAALVRRESDGGCKLLGEFFVNCGLTHSQTLVPMIEDLLRCCGVEMGGLDAFAVSAGPGSFTGLRIGMAAVKGMAFALQKPVAPVSTLEGLAYNLQGSEGILCPVMDARCQQVYTALFESDGSTVARIGPDRAVSIETLASELEALEKTVWLVGDGAQICHAALKDRVEHLRLAPEHLRYQRACSVALAALAGGAAFLPGSELEPFYLRLPQAERELKRKTDPPQTADRG